MLLQNGAKVEETNYKGQTPLHIACKQDSIDNVVALIVEGNADILSTDSRGDTPFHCTRNETIINLMLQSDTVGSRLFDFQDKDGASMYSLLLRRHPNSLPYFLDLMISSSNMEHSTFDGQTISYNISIFSSGTDSPGSYLNILFELIERGLSEHLRHPIMRLCTDIDWHNNLKIFFWNMFWFLCFLFTFSYHGFLYIRLGQCRNTEPDNCFSAGHPDYNKTLCPISPIPKCSGYSCQDNIWIDNDTSKSVKFPDITKCLLQLSEQVFNYDISAIKIAWFFTITTLILSPVMRMIPMLFKLGQNCKNSNSRKSKMNIKNLAEFLVVAFTLVFICLQDIDVWYARNFLGWALFVSWIYFTMLLSRFETFGEHIIVAWGVMKEVFCSLIVFIPSLIAFACAFYCFLIGDKVFNGFTSSIVKILVMMIGNLELLDDGGRNISVKVFIKLCH